MEDVADQMQAAIPQSFDVNANVKGNGTMGYFDMVAAFKEALSQVEVVLDDEVAGRFVDNTVTRLIYA